MKNYTITVNGNVYDVTVEENGAGAAPVQQQQLRWQHRKQLRLRQHQKQLQVQEAIQVKAGAAGKVFKIEANVGQSCPGRRSGCNH